MSIERPKNRLSALVLGGALTASGVTAATLVFEVETQHQESRAHALERLLPVLTQSVAESLRFAAAAGDVARLQTQLDSLIAQLQLDHVQVELASGATLSAGTKAPTAPGVSSPIYGYQVPAQRLLWNRGPLPPDRTAVLGTVTIRAERPLGLPAAGAGAADPLQRSAPPLLGSVVLMTAIAFWIRRRLLRLGNIVEATVTGTLDDAGVGGRDEIAWIADRLGSISDIIAEQVHRAQDQRAEMKRVALSRGERLDRMSGFAEVLVRPVDDAAPSREALVAFGEGASAEVAVLFAADQGTFAAAAQDGLGRAALHELVAPEELQELGDRIPEAGVPLSALPASHPWLLAAGRRVPLQYARVFALRAHGELVAAVVLAKRERFSDEDLAFARDSAGPMAIAIANRRAYVRLRELANALEVRNEALIKQRDELEVVSRLRNEFVANISHELRTPLNAILGFSELLLDGMYGDITEDQNGAVELIHRTGKDLLGLIDQVLDLSRSEAGQTEIVARDLDVASVVRAVSEMSEPLCRDAKLRLITVAPSIQIQSDPERVRQILVNLVGNAIKFTERGSVELHAEATPDGGASIHVRDSGLGIPPDQLKVIFEAFRQVDGSSTRTRGGVGLGLAISRRLARALGGELTVASTPGQGSTFSLHLPARAPVSADDEAANDDPAQVGRVRAA